MDHGLPADVEDEDGNTPLMLAAYHGHAETVRMLVERGADVDIRNARDQSPVAGASSRARTRSSRCWWRRVPTSTPALPRPGRRRRCSTDRTCSGDGVVATVLIIDGANVVGSRPDGWWRDRAGAAARPHGRLADRRPSYDEIVLGARGTGQGRRTEGRDGHLRTVHAAKDGDSATPRRRGPPASTVTMSRRHGRSWSPASASRRSGPARWPELAARSDRRLAPPLQRPRCRALENLPVLCEARPVQRTVPGLLAVVPVQRTAEV